MMASLPKVAIVASGQTRMEPGRADAQHIDLIAEAIRVAFLGMPLSMRDVDFVIDAGSDVLDGRSISNCGFLGAMGAHHKEESRVEEDGLWAVWYAWQKLLAGHADVGLVIGYGKPSEASVHDFYASQSEPFYQRPLGLNHLVAAGLQASQYLHRWRLDEAALARVAARDWANGAANPRVVVEEAPSIADIAGSGPVSPPLRELMLSRPVDGAAVVVLASERVARKLSGEPIWIRGMWAAMDEHSLGARDPGSFPACAAAASRAYALSALGEPNTVDLVEVSAHSAAGELMVLEALGLSEPGAGASVIDAAIGPAINPSGGALPADPIMATGLVRLTEAHLQAVREAGINQLNRDVRSAIVHATSGLGMQNHCVAVIGR
jgi:acetyl-CoA C-acetyltransferase